MFSRVLTRAAGVSALGLGATAYLTTNTVQAAAVDYKAVRADIADVLEDDRADYHNYGPMLVRLAWHCAGSYSAVDGSGGSNNATMRFSPEKDYGGNAGLDLARNLLESVKAKHPGISYADLYTLAGVVAVEEMGGPTVEWRSGRVDSVDNSPTAPDGRLPDAAQGAQHIRDVFGRMGFNDREAVVLSGAHCFGKCHTSRSGFEGPWTDAPTTFSNQYFTELLKDDWEVKSWNGPKQWKRDPKNEKMMLPTDMALKTDPVFRKVVNEFAADEDKFASEFGPAFSKLLHLGCDKVCPPVNNSAWLGKAALATLGAVFFAR